MAPTTPLCIEEAFRACQRGKKPNDRPIDILGVVSHVDQPSDRLTVLHVLDKSGKARIVYYGPQQQQKIIGILGLSHGGMPQSIRIKVGTNIAEDILRFNRVSLRSPRNNQNDAFVYEFHHSMYDREDGDDFCRLARTTGSGDVSLELIPTPPGFETNPEAIRELGKWFSESSYSQIPKLICQKQQILSIQVGQTLHVDANVDAVVMVDSQQSITSKRKRFYRKRRRQPGCYATLSDSTGSIGLFLDQQHSAMFWTIQTAHRNHRALGMTHVRATQSNTDDGLLLIPTISSRIQLIDPVERHPSSSIPDEATQSTLPVNDNQRSRLPRSHREEVHCTIRDICVKGVSLAHQKHTYLDADKVKGLHALLCHDEVCYSDVTLELMDASLGRVLTTNAKGSIVQKLLGDVSVDAWKTNIKMQEVVISLLLGMLDEPLTFIWNLEHRAKTPARENADWVVLDVRLAILHG